MSTSTQWQLQRETAERYEQMMVKQIDLSFPPLDEFAPRHIGATPMAAGYDAAPVEAQREVIHDMSQRLAPFTVDSRV